MGKGDDMDKEDGSKKPQFRYIVTKNGEIVRVDKSGNREPISVPRGGSLPVVDPTDDTLYYVLVGRNIMKVQPAVDGRQGLVMRGGRQINAIKIDPKNRRLYYSDQGRGVVGYVNLDTLESTIIYEGLSNPTIVSTDPLAMVVKESDSQGPRDRQYYFHK